jgi:hypothetical protein
MPKNINPFEVLPTQEEKEAESNSIMEDLQKTFGF